MRSAPRLRSARHGHTVIVAPLMRIEALSNAEIGDGPWAAILITSANAAHAIAAHARKEALAGLPVFAVGERSAQAMRDGGFADVTSADGGVGDLARLVGERMTPGLAPVSRGRGALRRSRGQARQPKFCRANDRGLSRRCGRVSAAHGNRCFGAGHRGCVALFAPHRRGLCERGPRRRVASERAKARPTFVCPPKSPSRSRRPAPAPSMSRSGPSRPR